MHLPHHRLTLAAACLGAAALVSASLLPVAQATSGHHQGPPPGWVKIPGSAYHLQSGEKDLGPAAPGSPARFTLSMKVPRQNAADALAKLVSEPRSPLYGRYLSPQQYRRLFAPSDGAAAQVTRWLRQAGMRIAYDPANHLTITATGTVAAADRAFWTDLHRYRTAPDADGNTTTFLAPKTPLFVPRNVNAVVAGFLEGINHAARLTQPMSSRADRTRDLPGTEEATTDAVHPSAHTVPTSRSAPPPEGFVNAGPCSRYWGAKKAYGTPKLPRGYAAPPPYAPCGYTPRQLQGAYGLSALHGRGIDGRGTTVAITDAYNAPTILHDANTYAAKHSQPRFRPGQFREVKPDYYRYGYHDTVNGDQCGEQGWYGEETLDVEAVHAMAPGANVLYMGGASCLDSDLLVALNTIVDQHRADLISNSWGDAGEEVDPVILATYHTVFVQAALEGIGVFYSSGDSGDEVDGTGTRQTDYPASDSWVTAVGGTSLAVGSADQYLFETGWGTGKSTLTDGSWQPAPPGSWVYGGGGGTSQVFAQPWYQRPVVPWSISHYFGASAGRAVPDVSALGDPNTGFLVGETQTFPDGVRYGEYRIGGTSLASPLMAGIEALADHVTPERHPQIGLVKDFGSGAVLCTLVLAGLLWGAALVERMGWL